MRHLKILGLLALAAAALAALAAGPAMATTLTSPTGTVTTGPIHALSEEAARPGTKHVLFHNEVANIECNVTLEGKVESHGTGQTAEGLLDQIALTNCTEGWTVEFVKRGSIQIHWTSGYNGIVTRSGSTVSATLHLGIFGTVECTYATSNTPIGTITGGNPATLHVEANIPREGGSALCGAETIQWTGSIVTTSALYVDK